MLGAQLTLISALPFVALLVAIALLPLVAPEWWHQNRNKALVAAIASLPILVYFLFNLWDQWALDKDEKELPGSQHEEVLIHEPLRIQGVVEMVILLGIILTILGAGRAAAGGQPWAQNVREVVIVVLALIGYVAGSQ